MYESLQQLVNPYIDEVYENIPTEVVEHLAAENFNSDQWNAWSPEKRLDLVKIFDKIRDARNAELAEVRAAHEYWFHLQDEIFEIAHQIDKLGSKSDVVGLGEKLALLQERWNNPEFAIASPQQTELEKNRAAANTSIIEMPEAVKFLTQNTGAAWTEPQILAIAAQCHVTLCAAVPPWVRMYVTRYFDVIPRRPAPYVKPGCPILATVTHEMVENLWVTGKAEAEYVSAESFSGAKDLYFTDPVPLVRADIRLTRAQLLRILKEWEGLKRTLAIPSSASAVVSPPTMPISPNNWDAHGLARLLSESLEPDMTHKKLADRYGVTRQRIGALLKEASPKKTDPFSALRSRSRAR